MVTEKNCQLALKDRFQFIACEALLPVLRRLPFGRVRALGLLGGGQNNKAWTHHPHRHQVFWDKDLDSWIEVDLADWGGRWHYFSGQYYDRLLPWIMRQYLHEGDIFIDVGANFGIHSLYASQLVSKSGRIFALEPSPSAIQRLQIHLLLNRISNIKILPVALGAEEGEAILHIDSTHLGTANLRQGFTESNEEVKVPLSTLDISVPPQLDQTHRALIKIDVEGFELHVLRGAQEWLKRKNTIFVVEVTPAWIKDIGGDPADLFNIFNGFGFIGYQIRRGGRRYSTAPIFLENNELPKNQIDYLFVRQSESGFFPWLMSRIGTKE